MEVSKAFLQDVAVLKNRLANLYTDWDGKESVLRLKEADYNWRQMEWWAWYFEMLCFRALEGEFVRPGDKYTSVSFDLKRSVNWDLKSKAIRSDDHRAILNDKTAMEASITAYGEHGAIIALCDVEYNDISREFQKWHTELKGGKSKYEREREVRTSVSRYRKTRAVLGEILLLPFTADSLPLLGTMRQGRNSNGKPRPEKYMLDLEDIEPFYVDRIVFARSNTPVIDGELPPA